MKLNTVITSFLVIILSVVSFDVFAQNIDNRSAHFNLQKGIALKGFDPVTFFSTDKPVRATGSISYTHKGVKYFFACNNNLSAFKDNPSQYEPQYGGWCAYNMSKDGKKVTAFPQIFTVKNNKLYFFHSEAAQEKWLAEEEMKQEADDNWVTIVKH